jgi:FMN reductase
MPLAIAISGSPSHQSKSKRLLAHAAASLSANGTAVTAIDLCDLPAEALLGRSRDAAVDQALAALAEARLVIVATPVYRASYSGLLKCFFDLLPQDALAGKAAVLIATGGSPAHSLVIDHALRPLVASVGGLSVATSIYGTDAQFSADGPAAALLAGVDRAVREAQEVMAHGVL